MAKETFDRLKPDTQPPPPPPSGFVDLDISNTAGTLDTFDVVFSAEADSNFYAVIYATMWTGVGVMSPKKSAFRLIASENVPATPFTIDVKARYLAKLGQPAVGNKIFVKVIIIDSVSGKLYPQGQLSTIVSGT